MRYIVLALILSWMFILPLVFDNLSTSKEIGRLKREAMRNRDDIIYLYDRLGLKQWHDHIDWDKEDLPSHR